MLQKNSPKTEPVIEGKNSFSASCHDCYTFLAPSPIHGVGVFAIEDLPADFDPFPDCLNQFTFVSWDHFEYLTLERYFLVEKFLYLNNEGVWVPDIPLNHFNPSFYLNSSKTPNCIHTDGRFRTIRPIAAKEELTFDYLDPL